MNNSKLDRLVARVRAIADTIEVSMDWTQPEIHLDLLQAILHHARRRLTQPREAVQTLALLRAAALTLANVGTPLQSSKLIELAKSANVYAPEQTDADDELP